MKTTQPDMEYFGEYPRYFRMHAHKLIAWGYQDALCRITSNNEYETNITGFIAEAIDDRFKTNSPTWLSHYFIKDDPPIRKEGSSGRSRPRPDIIIQANFKGRPEYTFEAKRLRVNGYGTDKYVGEDGIGCFVNCLYAKTYNEAAMLGYVQSESIVSWKNKVKEAISSGAKSLCLISKQEDKTIISDFPLEWTSEHKREQIGRSIVMHHILLDCQVNN